MSQGILDKFNLKSDADLIDLKLEVPVKKVIDTGSSFKIIDVIVENTSYFVTKKSEFNKILRKNKGSLEALIKEIQKI